MRLCHPVRYVSIDAWGAWPFSRANLMYVRAFAEACPEADFVQ